MKGACAQRTGGVAAGKLRPESVVQRMSARETHAEYKDGDDVVLVTGRCGVQQRARPSSSRAIGSAIVARRVATRMSTP